MEINGTKLSSKHVGLAYPWGDKYPRQRHIVTVANEQGTAKFPFYCNDKQLDEEGMAFAFYCLLSDALAYENANDMKDFMMEFGYKDAKTALPAWNGCKAAAKKVNELGLDILTEMDYLNENYKL